MLTAASFTIARTWKQLGRLSTDEWIKKMWYKGILLTIKKNEFELVLFRWMNLEPVIDSEASQKEKNKYHMLTHIHGIQKNGTDEPICREGMEIQI